MAIINYVGSLCPITLGHVACLVTARSVLIGETPPVGEPFSPGDQNAACLAAVRFNNDSHVKHKMQAKGLVHLPATDRRHLGELATAGEPWIRYDVRDPRIWARELETQFPDLHFNVWNLNGADDVAKYRKWNDACAKRRYITMGRPGYTDKVLDGLKASGTPSKYFVVGPELPDISSTLARKAIARGDTATLKTLLHDDVAAWCLANSPWAAAPKDCTAKDAYFAKLDLTLS